MPVPLETVTKIEAAHRQLREAIWLFFERRDAVSVHTLGAAALQLLSDIGREQGVDSNLLRPAFVRPEMLREYLSVLNAPRNFFKHADRDPRAALEFSADANRYYLIDGACTYPQLASDFPAIKVYRMWFSIAHPDLLQDGIAKHVARALLEDGVKADDYGLFLDLIRRMEG